MNLNDRQLHPNWRALATIDFPLKRFVRGYELQCSRNSSEDSTILASSNTSGMEIQKFYEDLIKDSNSYVQTTESLNLNSKISSIKEYSLLKFDRNKFFRFATTNNTLELAKFKYLANDVNVSDDFGWTGLMMAACEGATDAVQMLLQLGADKNIKDRTGRTAFDLAQINGFNNIADILQAEFKPIEQTEDQSRFSSNTSCEPFYCNTCEIFFTNTTQNQHLTSTVHQFNEKTKHTENKLNKYNISTKNRGLQLMVKQGWDRESGLGPTSSGRLYPIKTVIRKRRTGLGTNQEPARVTHFEAFDIRAVQNNKLSNCSRHKTRSRNDIRREKLRDWKREKRLRKELS